MLALRAVVATVVAATSLSVAGGVPPGRAPELPRKPKPTMGDRTPISYGQLRAGFTNPPMAYAPFMFWFWDTPLTPAAKARAAEMAAAVSRQRINPGYPFAIPTPWGAMPPEQWLSPDWFEALDGALKQAGRAGTYLGFCDEYGFPGGQAAGRVLAGHPELKAESLKWSIQDVTGGAKVALPEGFFTVAARIAKRIKPAPATPPIGPWIWHPTARGDGQTVYFRTRLEVGPARKTRYLDMNLTADDGWTLYVNGRRVAADGYWQRINHYDLRPYVHAGTNSIAVEARNVTGACGLTAGIHALRVDGTEAHQYTGPDWVCASTAYPGWTEPAYDDQAWVKASVVTAAGGAPWNTRFHQADRQVQIDASSLRVIGGGKPFEWTVPPGEWRVYTFTKYHVSWSGSPVNYLDERLPNLFMKLAYEPYERHFGDRLGRTLVGAFRDNEGAYGYKLAWSDSLPRRYQRDKHQDIRRLMPLLIDQDPGGLWAKARWDWFDVVSSIYADSYWQKGTDWLRRHGLYCMGHTWEETLMLQAASDGSHFKTQRALSMQGVDSLSQNWLSSHDFREAQSVSEFENRRFMSETLSVSGWDMSPTLMKRAVNCTTAWGVSQFVAIINLLSRNIKALGWPPDGYTENPYFAYLHQWADFTRRAGYITSHGHTAPDVLLLNPMDSLWALSGDGLFDANVPLDLLSLNGDFGSDALRMDTVYADAINHLTDARVEFLCADNHYLRKLGLRKGHLVSGPFAFRSIVMPPMLVMPLEVAAKLVAFARAGGHVYSLGDLPSASPEAGANDANLIALMKALRAEATFVQCTAGLAPEIANPGGALRSAITFESGAFPMIQQHRRIDGRDFFWLVNNTDEPRRFRVMVRGAKGAASVWNCETGQIAGLSSVQTPQGSRVAMGLRPNEGCWLVFDSRKPARRVTGIAPRQTVAQPLGGPWRWSIDPAVQPPVPSPVTLPADLRSTSSVVRELKSWNQCGLEAFSGYVDYATKFEVQSAGGSVRLDLGRVQHLAEVWVNGRSVGARLWAPYEFELTQHVRPGTNAVRIRVGNLIANNMGAAAEAGLFGPVQLHCAR